MSTTEELTDPDAVRAVAQGLLSSNGTIGRLKHVRPLRPQVPGRLLSYNTVLPDPAQGATWAIAVSQLIALNRPFSFTAIYMQRIRVPEGVDVVLQGRLLNSLRTAFLFLADVSAVTLNVFDLSSETKDVPVHSEELVVSDVMFDQLQDDAAWRRDKVGYSYRVPVSGEHLREGGRIYRVEVFFKTSSGPIGDVWEIATTGFYSSEDSWGS